MRPLETQAFWPDLLRLKDELSLRELSERFEVSPGAISSALKRTGTARTPAAAPERDDDLPPEPTEGGASVPRPRPGSKDHMIHAYLDKLGAIPDAEVARLAGVSVRTIASFRARHNIPGYSGPRRSSSRSNLRQSKIEDFAHLVGRVRDADVAEQAGVSVNAIRNYRTRQGITSANRGGVAGDAPGAWRIDLDAGGVRVIRVVIAATLTEAATRAEAAAPGLSGRVVALQFVGEVV